MEEQIQFIANCGDWKVIKKLTINEAVPDLDKVDFLASVNITFDTKVDEFLRKIVDFKPIDEYINSLVEGKAKKEEDFAKILKGLASLAAGKTITAAIPETAEKQEKEKLKIYLKIIMTKMALLKAGLQLDYSKVPITINKKKKK